LNLRYRIKEDIDNDEYYIKEFLNSIGIYNEEYFDDEKIDLLMKFLKKEDFQIDPKKNLKQNISDIMMIDASKLELHKQSVENIGLDINSKGIQAGLSNSEIKKKRPVPVKVKQESIDFCEIQNKFRAAFDMTNQKSLCDKLEKDFKKNGVVNNESLLMSKDHGGKYLVSKKQPGILISTLHNEQQMLPEEYEKLKRKNKLLEFIVWKRMKNDLLLEEEKKKLHLEVI